MLWYLTAVVAIASVNAQFSPGIKPACNLQDVIGGAPFLPHETYCQLFYQCDSAPNQEAKLCSNGTLWDPELSTCNYAALNTCPTWSCTPALNGQRYPDVCCDKYWICDGSGFVRARCPAGTSFQMSTGNCTITALSTCANHALCPTSTSGSTGVCHLKANTVGDPCSFMINNGQQDVVVQCPVTTQYTPTSCGCHTLNTNCGISVPDTTANKDLDPLCRASLRVDFSLNSYSPTTYSDKLNVVPTQLPFAFSSQGYTPVAVGSSTFGGLSRATTGETPYLYNYYFNVNQLKTPVAFSVEFSYSNPQDGTTFELLSNNYANSVTNTLCNPATISATARYSAPPSPGFQGTWTFSVTIYGLGNARSTTETGSIQVLNASTYIELIIMIDNTVSLQIVERGGTGVLANPTNVVNPPSSGIAIGPSVGFTKCGMVIGRGLNGNIAKFATYEGCGNFAQITA